MTDYVFNLTLTYDDGSTKVLTARVPETSRQRATQELRRIIQASEDGWQKYSRIRQGLVSWDVEVTAEEPMP